MKAQKILDKLKLVKSRKEFAYLPVIFTGFLVFTIPYDTNYSNISLIALGVFFLVFFSFTNFKKTLKNKSWQILSLNALVFLMGLFFIKESVASPNFDVLGKYILLAALPLLLFNQIEQYGQKIILLSFCTGVVLGILWCFMQEHFFRGIGKTNYSNFTEPMGGIHAPYLSQFVAMAFFFLLELFFKLNRVTLKMLTVVVLFFMIFSLVYLQARMPLLAFAVCLFLYIMFKTYNEKNSRYFKYSSLIIISGLILFFILISTDDLYLIKERFLENSANAFSLRLNSWGCAWQAFMDHSKIFGVGFSNTQWLLDECYKSNYFARPYFQHYNTHNQYLQTLVTSGIIGLAVWLITLGYALRKVIKNRNVLGIIFLVLFMICCMTEVYLARIWGVLYFSAFYFIFVIKNYKIA